MFTFREVNSVEDRYQILRDVFGSSHHLDDAQLDELTEFFVPIDFKNGEHIVAADKQCKHIYLICTGTCYGYLPSADGDNVVALAYQKDLVTSLNGFNSYQPASFAIKAYSPIKALRIGYSDLQLLFEKHRALEQWFLNAMFHVIAGMEVRLASTAMPAEQRFERLISNSPHVLQLFPQRILASYLSMTPETFSRLRKMHAKRS